MLPIPVTSLLFIAGSTGPKINEQERATGNGEQTRTMEEQKEKRVVPIGSFWDRPNGSLCVCALIEYLTIAKYKLKLSNIKWLVRY